MAGKIVCPHCWHVFQVEKILAIAQHTDLLGDPVLGDNAPQRFLPSRFTPDGRALDAYGVPCPDFACPQCHLVIPRTLTQKPPLFFSIIGAPASGKSYLLTAMTWELRRLMPREFGFAFGDADASSNAIVNEYERTLFMNADDEGWTTLEKTEMQGRMYDRVRLHNMDVWLPRPLLFSLSPQPNHPQYTRSASQLTQTLVVYDNAGEAFQPDRDTAANPGTRHLARSNGMFFLFDPTKDPRFRAECQSGDPQTGDGAQVEQQEILLSEAISRVKRHSDSSLSQRLDRPLIVVVTKYDVWRSLLGYSLPNPWRKLSSLATAALDLDAVGAVSFAVRQLLMRFCPQIVATAESFSSQVSYLPGSAIGHSPTAFRRLVKLPGKDKKEQKTFLLVRPRDIQPIWAPVPVVQMLAHFGLVPVLTHKRTEEHPKVKSLRLSGNSVIFNIPGTNRRLEAPSAYLGRLLRCVETGKLFWLPSAEEIDAAARRLRGQ